MARTINVKNVYELEVNQEEDGRFCLRFSYNASSRDEKKINIHLERWWIKPIAQQLWNYIKKDQTALDMIKKSMSDQ